MLFGPFYTLRFCGNRVALSLKRYNMNTGLVSTLMTFDMVGYKGVMKMLPQKAALAAQKLIRNKIAFMRGSGESWR